jgi:hypothetical protein
MDDEQPIDLLRIYRRGFDDDEPQFEETAARVREEPELAAFAEREAEVRAALQHKLGEIVVPAGLLEMVLQQKQMQVRPSHGASRIWRLAAIIVVLCSLAIYWLRPAPRNTFGAYEVYLAKLVSHPYRMSLESSDLRRIRTFLANNQAPADYEVHPSLAQSDALGCATLSWSGNPVSMLCFRGKDKRKLFLFVVNRAALPDSPAGSAPRIRQEGNFAVAGWTEGNRAYVLAVEGDTAALEQFL